MVEPRLSDMSESEILRILLDAELGRVPSDVRCGNSEKNANPMEVLPINFVNLPRARVLKPELDPRDNNCYRLAELMGFHDTAFVSTAYRVILQRSPDAGGFNHYLDLLRDGVSKPELLGRLRYSAEGKLRAVKVKGLSAAMARAMFFRIPLLGYAFEIVVTLLRLPVVIRNIRRFESYTALSHESVREDLDALADAGNRNFNKLNSRR